MGMGTLAEFECCALTSQPRASESPLAWLAGRKRTYHSDITEVRVHIAGFRTQQQVPRHPPLTSIHTRYHYNILSSPFSILSISKNHNIVRIVRTYNHSQSELGGYMTIMS